MAGRGTLGLGWLVRLALVLVVAGLLWGGGAAVFGDYHLNRTTQDMTCGAREIKVAFLVRMYQTQPCGPGGATGVTANGALPCIVYVAGHDAQAAFSGPDAGENCATLVRSDPNGAGWTRNPQPPPGASSYICKLAGPNALDTAVVSDSGSAIYGTAVCNLLSGEGWKPASA